MQTTFKCDKNLAKSTDATSVIREPGKHLVIILQADTITRTAKATGQGYQFIRLLVENMDKARQTIELCIDGGKSDWQAKLFHSILVCAHVDDATFTPGQVRPHSRGYIEEKNVSGLRCLALEKKRLGVVFQRVLRDYEYQGQIKEVAEMQLVKAFDPDTEKTASEIIEGKAATRIAQTIATLKDRDNRKHKGTAPKASAATDSASDSGYSFDDAPF